MRDEDGEQDERCTELEEHEPGPPASRDPRQQQDEEPGDGRPIPLAPDKQGDEAEDHAGKEREEPDGTPAAEPELVVDPVPCPDDAARGGPEGLHLVGALEAP